MPVLILGESLHGAREYALYKLSFLKDLVARGQSFTVFFEADALGLEILGHRSPEDLLRLTFPRIFRTVEYRDILTLLTTEGIPFHGMDCRPRIPSALVPAHRRDEFNRLTARAAEGGFTDAWFDFRDEFMASRVKEVVEDDPTTLVVCLTHNLHAKRCGSREREPRLRLKSLREHLDATGIPTQSVGLFGLGGMYWEVDLSPSDFHIDDPGCFERSVDLRWVPARDVDAKRINPKVTAFHCGTERESTPVASNYDRAVVFRTLTRPLLLD